MTDRTNFCSSGKILGPVLSPSILRSSHHPPEIIFRDGTRKTNFLRISGSRAPGRPFSCSGRGRTGFRAPGGSFSCSGRVGHEGPAEREGGQGSGDITKFRRIIASSWKGWSAKRMAASGKTLPSVTDGGSGEDRKMNRREGVTLCRQSPVPPSPAGPSRHIVIPEHKKARLSPGFFVSG